jgi:hypothetical protein
MPAGEASSGSYSFDDEATHECIPRPAGGQIHSGSHHDRGSSRAYRNLYRISMKTALDLDDRQIARRGALRVRCSRVRTGGPPKYLVSTSYGGRWTRHTDRKREFAGRGMLVQGGRCKPGHAQIHGSDLHRDGVGFKQFLPTSKCATHIVSLTVPSTGDTLGRRREVCFEKVTRARTAGYAHHQRRMSTIRCNDDRVLVVGCL